MLLQNLGALAYVDRTAYMVVGERFDQFPPYACLVNYDVDNKKDDSRDNQAGDRRIGVELLFINQLGGCQKVDKAKFIKDPIEATKTAQTKYEDKIRWAVSGYPLIIGGIAVP